MLIENHRTSSNLVAGRTLCSHVAISYAAKTRDFDYAEDQITLDKNSYQFVVDTGTTFYLSNIMNCLLVTLRRPSISI